LIAAGVVLAVGLALCVAVAVGGSAVGVSCGGMGVAEASGVAVAAGMLGRLQLLSMTIIKASDTAVTVLRKGR
jgi:hypothetical protein